MRSIGGSISIDGEVHGGLVAGAGGGVEQHEEGPPRERRFGLAGADDLLGRLLQHAGDEAEAGGQLARLALRRSRYSPGKGRVPVVTLHPRLNEYSVERRHELT